MDRKNHRRTLKEIFIKLYSTFGPQHWWPAETPFEIAIGAILTQNTNWQNVERAIRNIKERGILEPAKLYVIKTDELAKLIRPAGYYNVKAKRLKIFVDFLVREFSGRIENMALMDTEDIRKRLLELDGIGPETADSIILYALNKPVFVIDAYTKRVLSRHGIIEENASYEEVQSLFHKNLERDSALYNEYHALFVRLGKTFCKTKPVCEGCPLDERNNKKKGKKGKN
ncbi:MAG: endonuclease III domain-containing protein [Thermodesulfovibrionales bacterium]|nr:endonuclease III domain-containing protein [Thermodesulfovibrionales bacterium]